MEQDEKKEKVGLERFGGSLVWKFKILAVFSGLFQSSDLFLGYMPILDIYSR